MHANEAPFTPPKEAIAALEPFERLPLERIALVATAAQAARAIAELNDTAVLGFDTESKPTFAKGEVSDGPHIVQLASRERAWIFQLHDAECRAALCALLESNPAKKVGFGLGDDLRRIRGKLGVEAREVVDLNHLFRGRGYRKDIGVKTAVAILFERRFMKSGKASTSNWAARELSPSQLMYAANDAWAAFRVYDALARLPAGVRSPA
jgi:ribonuclease D